MKHLLLLTTLTLTACTRPQTRYVKVCDCIAKEKVAEYVERVSVKLQAKDDNVIQQIRIQGVQSFCRAQSVTYEFKMGTGYKTKILTPLDSCDTVEFIQWEKKGHNITKQ